jgi:hypothetical protein
MRSNARALDRPVLSGPKASTSRAQAGHDQRRRVPVKRSHLVLVLLAVTVIALMVRPGTGAEASCGATVVGEFACLEGQLPQEQAGRSCVVYNSVYGTNFWRCALDR